MPTFTVPLLADGDQERLTELQRAVGVAERNAVAAAASPLRIGDDLPGDAVEDARAAYNEFLDEAAKRGESWVLESIGHEEFRELLKQHPPRKVTTTAADGSAKEVDDAEDADWGVNTETFPKALLLYVDPEDPAIRTVAELKVSRKNIAGDPEAMRKRVKRLSAGQFEALWTSAYVLNKNGVTDPKSDRFSAVTLKSTAT